MLKAFEKKFWSGTDLNQLYANVHPHRRELSGLEHIFVVGFEELETSELTVFPNPSSDNFMISTDFNETFVATVIDAKGIVVETRTVNGADQVQLGASLNKGIYTIQLISNQRLLQSKVVKN